MLIRNALFLGMAALLVVFLSGCKKNEASQIESIASFPTSSPDVKTLEIKLKNKTLDQTPQTLKAFEGENVVLKVTGDEEEELHIHGYDLTLGLSANEPKELTFVADKTGRFEIELHSNETVIAALEVLPK